MASSRQTPWVPRNGHTLVVGIVARISGCANQKEMSLEDQIDHAKQIVKEHYDGPVEYRVIETVGKGEALDRPELARLEALLRSNELDVLVAEDIGRIIRGAIAVRICGVAVDHHTRVLAPNDGVDTFDDSWEEDVISACRDHVGHNAHTSKRIKQKKMNRFNKFGGSTPCEIYGYCKPTGAKTFSDWTKNPEAIPVYREWYRILDTTLNGAAVAEWLNNHNVPVGPHCRRKTWDGAMVLRITRNTMLKGVASRGTMHTVKLHETGRRVSVKNPNGPEFYDCPHLAFWTAAEFDDLNARLDAKNAKIGRKPANGIDPRSRVPRTRTRFPGQHARCWYCGHHVVWGGNGITEHLMCSNARQWRCWNSVGFSGVTAVANAVAAEFAQLDGFDEQFRELIELAGQEGNAGLIRDWAELQRDEDLTEKEKKNVVDAISAYGPQPMIAAKLKEIEDAQRGQARRRSMLQERQSHALQLPKSAAELRALFEDRFCGLAHDSYEFGDLLRLIVPEFHVYLVRLCDGGHPLPRARIRLNLAGLVPDARHVPEFEERLTRTLTIDLFVPPQREQIRTEATRLSAQGLNQYQIAERLEVTQPVVSKALKLDRMMRERGLETPYLLIMEPPKEYPKLRRHLNPKYQFEATEGYQRPTA